MMNDILDPPAAHGEPLFTAVLKKQATDFRVFEELDISFSGDGEHLFVQIEKTAMNTDEVVSSLQKCYGVSSADVGLSGLKDRHSVSTQWFSVRTPENSEQFEKRVIDFNEEQQALWGKSDGYLKSMRLLRSERHSRKLRRGAHRRNNFVITLREVKTIQAADTQLQEQVDKRVRVMCELGFPNYIGSQRFGNHGQNFQRAKQWFSNPRKRTSRQQRSIWLSASRSALFNKVCAARVRAGNWTRLLDGEPAMLDGNSSFFVTGVEGEESSVMVESGLDGIERNGDERGGSERGVSEQGESERGGSGQSDTATSERLSLEQRLLDFDIHPSAPWWGRGRSPAHGECAEFEALQLQDSVTVCEGLERAGLSQERRAIRASAEDLKAAWLDDGSLELSFSLAPGIFATTLLREFCRWEEPTR